MLKNVTEPDTQDSYLENHLDVWISPMPSTGSIRTRPRTAGVVFYDEVCGFYLDRPYLWGNAGHSSYIPYDQMKNGNDLTAWMLKNRHHLRADQLE